MRYHAGTSGRATGNCALSTSPVIKQLGVNANARTPARTRTRCHMMIISLVILNATKNTAAPTSSQTAVGQLRSVSEVIVIQERSAA
jgi:hypothetical protein